jgi:(2Fe-2S) ferredoxin
VSGYERMVFVCQNERPPDHPKGSCLPRGSADVLKAFKTVMSERGLKETMRACGSTCLEHCRHGVSVVVFPDNTWYGHVTPSDVAEIVDEHLIGGRPVERLVIPAEAPRG